LKLHRILLPAFAAAFSLGLAHADTRHIPDDARRAIVSPIDISNLLVDGVPRRLAPGVRILDDANRYITPSRVPEGAVARLRLQADASIAGVWLLTVDEAQRTDPLPPLSKN